MPILFIQSELAQPATAVLRAATHELHEELHRHPLIEELLTHPTFACYRAVLEAFFTFYRQVEVRLVERARSLGLVEQYPRAMRTEWLLADLKTLGCGDDRLAALSNHQAPPELTEVGELAGCLYVVKGSALGGRSILDQLARKLSVEQSCRFFTGDGSGTARVWKRFTQFCNDTCRGIETRRLAILAAEQTFVSIADCLTRSANDGK